MAAGPHLLVLWARGLVAYSNDLGVQSDLAPVVGLYAPWTPSAFRLISEVVGITAALIVTLAVWHRRNVHPPAPFHYVAYLWFLWFLVAPYGHFHDEIVRLLPVGALMGRDGRTLDRFPDAVMLYLLLLSLVPLALHPGGVQLLSLPLVAMLVISYRSRRRNHQDPNLQDERPATA